LIERKNKLEIFLWISFIKLDILIINLGRKIKTN